MKTLKYFELFENATITEKLLKNLWRKIVLKVHPDKGGTDESFKEAQNEYDYLLSHIGASFTANQDDPNNFADFDEFLANIDPSVKEAYLEMKKIKGITKWEICGSWIWVSLDYSQKTEREELKKISIYQKGKEFPTKFRFAKGKKKWAWAGSTPRGHLSMNKIRAVYGSKKFQEEEIAYKKIEA